eukprot:6163536-Amphidinium_carterae.1
MSGFLPAFATTFEVLALFGNSLKGHLPEMHMDEYFTIILVHDNMFSCNLPLLGGKKAGGVVLALLGNSIKHPNAFPPWISPDERGEFFCVSNRHVYQLVLKLSA